LSFNNKVSGRAKRFKSLTLPEYGWKNHPAVLMWKNYEYALLEYGLNICNEWISRGYKDNCKHVIEKFISDYNFIYTIPEWLGNEEFHRSHQSNLMRKFPEHYKKFFHNVPDDLPYFWPVKIIK